MKIVSLSQAKELGLTHYFTGKFCKHDHLCERKVLDRSCVECNKDKQQRHAHKSNEWYHSNKERAKMVRKNYYETHKDEFIKRAREWGKQHPERLRELQNNWRRSEKGKSQSRDWVAANKESHYARTKDWKERNPDLIFAARFPWGEKFTYGDYPRRWETCDWDIDHKGPEPRYWRYVKHAACHYLVNFNLRLALLSVSRRQWRILTSDVHSTVWDGEDTLFEFNFYALHISPDECFRLANKEELAIGRYLLEI